MPVRLYTMQRCERCRREFRTGSAACRPRRRGDSLLADSEQNDDDSSILPMACCFLSRLGQLAAHVVYFVPRNFSVDGGCTGRLHVGHAALPSKPLDLIRLPPCSAMPRAPERTSRRWSRPGALTVALLQQLSAAEGRPVINCCSEIWNE